MRGRPRLAFVVLGLSAAVALAACGGSAATPLPTLPPVTDAPVESESPAVETLAPAETEPPAAASDEPTEAPPATEGTKYKVKKGDTLWGIAQKYAPDYGMTVPAMVTAIKKANPKIKSDNVIHVGQVLVIPPQ
jgi:Tfp pilus assembly protein FimV